jgi:hypothetical protein
MANHVDVVMLISQLKRGDSFIPSRIKEQAA